MSSTLQDELFVIITGSSRGAEAGYDAGISYREKERRARQVATRVEDLGRKAVLLPGDISTPDGQQHLATSDALDDHPTVRLLERANPGMLARRWTAAGRRLPLVTEFASVIGPAANARVRTVAMCWPNRCGVVTTPPRTAGERVRAHERALGVPTGL
jgi:hypothetical protein